MNFGGGGFGGTEVLFLILIWALPFVIAIWFIRTLSSIARSLRDVVDRLDSVERAIRERP
jgi:hypothetical protein